MAQGTNKPDLSDLKARLGLQKPSAPKATQSTPDAAQAVAERAPAPPSATSPPPGHSQPPGRSQPPGAGAPIPAAERAPGPGRSQPPGHSQPSGAGAPIPAAQPSGPPHAMSGPPAASAPPSSRTAAPRAEAPAPSPSRPVSSPSMDVHLDTDDFKTGGGVFSPMILGLFVAILVVGIIFGWVASSSGQQSALFNSQTADAKRIEDALEPKIAEFEKANATIAKLSASTIDFESAKGLAALDFTIDGNVLRGERLLLGSQLIDQITGYSVDSNLLKTMLEEHDRMTNKVDRKELEELQENNELLEKDHFAILFNYDYLAKNSGNDNYMPGRDNRLVNVTSLEKDEDGRIEVAFLNSGDTAQVHVQNILPLEKNEILKTSGPDALQRYKNRVEQIKFRAASLDKRTSPLMGSLQKISSRDKAGFF